MTDPFAVGSTPEDGGDRPHGYRTRRLSLGSGQAVPAGVAVSGDDGPGIPPPRLASEAPPPSRSAVACPRRSTTLPSLTRCEHGVGYVAPGIGS